MSDAPLSLAIPFHRGLPWLREAVASVAAQTDDGWCCVVRDDCGEADSDAVRTLVASFRDSRIRYERNEHNLGMVANWNRCIDRAETDLVALLHADDRLLPDYVTTLRRLAGEHPDAVAGFCGAGVIGDDGQPRFSLADFVKRFFEPRGGGEILLRGENGLAHLLAGNFIMCPTLCLRRSILGERRFDTRFRQVQDLELTSRLLLQGETLVGTRARAYAYRRHATSATEIQSESLLRFEEEFGLLAEVAERSADRGWPRAARVGRSARIVKLHLLYRALRDLLGFRGGPASRKLRLLRRHST